MAVPLWYGPSFADVRRKPMAEGGETSGAVVRLFGEYDVSTLLPLAALLAAAVAEDAGEVVVDASGVLFMDGASVGLLVDSQLVLAQQSRTLRVRHPSVAASRVLHACEVEAVLGIEPTKPRRRRSARV